MSDLDTGTGTYNINLLLNEFIDGVKPGDNEDPEALSKMIYKLKLLHGWNDSIPFVRLSSQNCSDMLVQTGNSIVRLNVRGGGEVVKIGWLSFV